MELLLLVGLSVLLAGPGSAEVVQEFSSCSKHFYKATPPTGFETQNDRKICQKYQNKYHFATLYSIYYRIPIWSAYTLDTTSCTNEPLRRSVWFIEPQLTNLKENKEMMTLSTSGVDPAKVKQEQALSTDYESTDYDRGHLNPNAFQCGVGRQATFTLTNAAPMDPCFNRIYWYNNEKSLKTKLKNNCANKKGIAFLVTGTVPNNNKKIPDPDKDGESDNPNREFSRVSVPSHIWTAVCCHFKSTGETWSEAFLAENKPQSDFKRLPVNALQEYLKQVYRSPNLKIFADESCNGRTVPHLIMTMEEITLEDETGSETPEF